MNITKIGNSHLAHQVRVIKILNLTAAFFLASNKAALQTIRIKLAIF